MGRSDEIAPWTDHLIALANVITVVAEVAADSIRTDANVMAVGWVARWDVADGHLVTIVATWPIGQLVYIDAVRGSIVV